MQWPPFWNRAKRNDGGHFKQCKYDMWNQLLLGIQRLGQDSLWCPPFWKCKDDIWGQQLQRLGLTCTLAAILKMVNTQTSCSDSSYRLDRIRCMGWLYNQALLMLSSKSCIAYLPWLLHYFADMCTHLEWASCSLNKELPCIGEGRRTFLNGKSHEKISLVHWVHALRTILGPSKTTVTPSYIYVLGEFVQTECRRLINYLSIYICSSFGRRKNKPTIVTKKKWL